MKITDAHVHFWDVDRLDYPWLDDVPVIRRSFGPPAYQEATCDLEITNLIFVQCECRPEQYLQEIEYVSGLALEEERIKGIVSWFPLEEPGAGELLEALTVNPLIRGVRRLEESPESLYRRPAFIENMDLLAGRGLSMDLCIQHHQLPAVLGLIDKKPENHYMLDHLGKPGIAAKELTRWKEHIAVAGQNPNVYCKFSGMVTEADWATWTTDDLMPYAAAVLEHFGPERLVFGGDWPVVTLASGYRRWVETALELLGELSATDRNKVFFQNAIDFYRIEES